MENQLTAPHTAIRTNRARHLSIINARMHRTRLFRHRLETSAIFALENLPNERPFRKQRKHNIHPFLRGWSEFQSLENVIVQRAKPAKTNAYGCSHRLFTSRRSDDDWKHNGNEHHDGDDV